MESLRFPDTALQDVEFSPAQLRVIAAIREGCSSHSEIAQRLRIQPITARGHTWRIRKKLGLLKFVQLDRWVQEHTE
jgi:DNA-binding NarL/FixJ family response regulator